MVRDCADALQALERIGYIEDSDDLVSLGVQLDLLCSAILDLELISPKLVASASVLSEVLGVLSEHTALDANASDAARKLEECISQGEYGLYAPTVITRAADAQDALAGVLEPWLKTLSDG